MHRFSRRDLLRSGAIAAAGVGVAGRSHGAVATAPGEFVTDGSIRIRNLPKDFYARPGLADMPRIDYESLPVVNVRDYGAHGDGVTSDNAAFDAAVLRHPGQHDPPFSPGYGSVVLHPSVTPTTSAGSSELSPSPRSDPHDRNFGRHNCRRLIL